LNPTSLSFDLQFSAETIYWIRIGKTHQNSVFTIRHSNFGLKNRFMAHFIALLPGRRAPHVSSGLHPIRANPLLGQRLAEALLKHAGSNEHIGKLNSFFVIIEMHKIT
jgi:hypothetical protein